MARVTIEDCLEKVPNRFALVHMTSQRVRQLRDGAPSLIESKNKEIVQALREIADGSVYPVSKEEAHMGRAKAEAIERARLAQASLAASHPILNQDAAAATASPTVDQSAEEANEDNEA